MMTPALAFAVFGLWQALSDFLGLPSKDLSDVGALAGFGMLAAVSALIFCDSVRRLRKTVKVRAVAALSCLQCSPHSTEQRGCELSLE